MKLAYNHPLSARPSVRKSPNLVTTTPPKRLHGLSLNFQKIFFYMSSCASEKTLALRLPSLEHTTFSLVFSHKPVRLIVDI